MKRCLALVVFGVLLLSAHTAVAGPFGPATPAEGTSVGGGYFYSSADLDVGDATLKQNRAYLRLGAGLSENFEAYVRAGVADIEIEEYDDSFAPYIGGGFKTLLMKRRNFVLGGFVDGDFFSDYDDGDLEVSSLYEINAGLNIETVIEGAKLYAGPVFYVREMDLEAAGESETVEEDGNFGGFVGASWKVKDRFNINAEVQFKTDFSGGIEVLYNF